MFSGRLRFLVPTDLFHERARTAIVFYNEIRSEKSGTFRKKTKLFALRVGTNGKEIVLPIINTKQKRCKEKRYM